MLTDETRATDEISRAEWLSALAPGDEAIIDGRSAFDLVKVARRTKSGRIVVTYGHGEKEFNPDGSGRGGGPFDYASLEMPTQARRQRIERANLAYELSNVNWRKLTLAQLRAHKALLS